METWLNRWVTQITCHTSTVKAKEAGRQSHKAYKKHRNWWSWGWCSYWLHAECQKVSDDAYEFLSSNENTVISWYCSHCKPAAMGVVAEVQKIAQKYMDIDNCVKKLQTHINTKQTLQTWHVRKTVLEDMDDKVTAADLTNMQLVMNESTKKIVLTHKRRWQNNEACINSAVTEIQTKIPTTDRIKQLIQEPSAAPSNQPTTPSPNTDTRYMVEISNPRNNVVIYRLTEQKGSNKTKRTQSRHPK